MLPPRPPGDHVNRHEIGHGSVLVVVCMGLGERNRPLTGWAGRKRARDTTTLTIV
jgi:hypothetical protein